jgi:branched-chain amino acid transport system substrate-binding protein
MMAKRGLLGLCVFGLAAVALVGLAGAQPLGKTEIVFGGAVSLTGPASFDGIYYKKGYELWMEQTNKRGGILGAQVKLILYDDKSNPNEAVSRYEKLISVDKVDFLLGPWTSGITAPVAAVAQKYGRLFVEGGGCAEPIFQRGNKWIFSTMTAVDHQHSQNLFEWIQSLAADQRPSTATLTFHNSLWAQGCAKGVRARAAETGVKLLLDEAYSPTMSDATPLVSKIKAANPDMILNCGYLSDGVLIVRTLKELKVGAKVLWMSDGPPNPAWGSILGEVAKYSLGTTHWEPGVPYNGARELTALYKEKFNEDIYDKVALAWASLQVYEQAIRGVKSLDQEKLREYIRTQTFDLVVGPTRFAENGMPMISTLLDIQWVDGKRIVVWPKKDRVLSKPIEGKEIVFPKPAW